MKSCYTYDNLLSQLIFIFMFINPVITKKITLWKKNKFRHCCSSSRIRVFAQSKFPVSFSLRYTPSFLGALNFLGEEASAPPIKGATRGGSGWPEPTLGRSFGRIRRRALHQDLIRSLARSLAEIAIPRDGSVVASLSLPRRYIEIHPACSPPSFRVAASSPPYPIA